MSDNGKTMANAGVFPYGNFPNFVTVMGDIAFSYHD